MISADTIAAISTPPGTGAIGVVRLSGPKSSEIIKRLWISTVVSVDNLSTHRLYYGFFHALSTPDAVIDQVMIAKMTAPHTYTGEDMIEIYAHGGPLILQKIMGELLRAGARLAEAGEFTRRAYLNGKMDLAQAEAVADMIHAISEQGLRNAREQLTGRLSARIGEMMQRLTMVRMSLEAAIDFPEDGIVILSEEGTAEHLTRAHDDITRLLATYDTGRLFRTGARVAIVGRPNVGKSSLLNRLLGHERAIVHDEAGTTRDTIEEAVMIHGMPFRLIDTAGLRENADLVEKMGIERSRQAMELADIWLMIVDGSAPLSDEDRRLLTDPRPPRAIIVVNKTDRPANIDSRAIATLTPFPVCTISALTGSGMAELESQMVASCQSGHLSDGMVITHLRHKEALEEAAGHITTAIHDLARHQPEELIAASVAGAMTALGTIIGTVSVDSMLNRIFSDFCVGK